MESCRLPDCDLDFWLSSCGDNLYFLYTEVKLERNSICFSPYSRVCFIGIICVLLSASKVDQTENMTKSLLYCKAILIVSWKPEDTNLPPSLLLPDNLVSMFLCPLFSCGLPFSLSNCFLGSISSPPHLPRLFSHTITRAMKSLIWEISGMDIKHNG